MGGLSGEREVSIRSGEAILAALTERGHDACPVFVDRDLDMVLRQARIDVAFLALHGRYGEDGCVQGMLELLGIPYTGSSVLSSALAMNKAKTKEVLRLHNLPTAPGYMLEADSGEDLLEAHGTFGFPVVVKPVGEGSSLGVSVAHDELEFERAVEEAFRFDDQVLIERFVDGREVSVAVLDGRPLGAVEIVPKKSFYDFQMKALGGRSDYHFPPRLTAERYRAVLRFGVMAHEALGCEGATRVDMIVSDRGNEIILEVNTLPGMAPNSLLPKIAHGCGLSFEDLCEEILSGARLRAHGHRRDRRAVQVDFEGQERRIGLAVSAH